MVAFVVVALVVVAAISDTISHVTLLRDRERYQRKKEKRYTRVCSINNQRTKYAFLGTINCFPIFYWTEIELKTTSDVTVD